jgi:hypothetical protein
MFSFNELVKQLNEAESMGDVFSESVIEAFETHGAKTVYSQVDLMSLVKVYKIGEMICSVSITDKQSALGKDVEMVITTTLPLTELPLINYIRHDLVNEIGADDLVKYKVQSDRSETFSYYITYTIGK